MPSFTRALTLAVALPIIVMTMGCTAADKHEFYSTISPDGPGATVVDMMSSSDPDRPDTTFVPHVHPIRRTGRSVGHLVSVGRTSNNDVVISDVSVSRFHAFLKEGLDNTLRVQDAGSTNGTRLNGRPVPVQGHGEPSDLKSGDRLRVGHVDLTFLEAELLIRLLRTPGS